MSEALISLWEGVPAWLRTIVWASACGSVLAGGVMMLLPMLRRHVGARWRVALWLVVLVRFIPVALPESRWSLFNLLPGKQAAVMAAAPDVKMLQPTVAAGRAEGDRSAVERVVTSDAAMPGDVVTAADSRVEAVAARGEAPRRVLWLALVYLIAAVVVLVRLLLASLALRRIIENAAVVNDPMLLALLESSGRLLGVRARIRLLITPALASPALVGFFRPRLLIPAPLAAKLSAEEFRLIFLHEAGHHRRNDILLNYLLAAISVVHWFNPMVWLMLPRVRAERELACDELVLHFTADQASYGHLLLKLFQQPGPMRAVSLAVGIIDTKTFFTRRIQMIAQFKKRPVWVAAPAALAVVLLGACILTNAQSSPSGATTESAARSVEGGVPADTARGLNELKNLTTEQAAGHLFPRAQTRPVSLNEATLTKLGDPIKELHVEKIPLERVIDFLRDTTGANIYVNWRSLEATGVLRDVPISLQLVNVPFRKALNAVLDEAGTGVEFIVEDGVITITSDEDGARIMARSPTSVPGAETLLPRNGDSAVAQLQDRLTVLRSQQAQLADRGGGPAAEIAQLHTALEQRMAAQRSAQGMGDAGRAGAASLRPGSPKETSIVPTRMQVYDVHSLIGAEKQAGVLTADQQSAVADLVRTLAVLSRDANVTITSFNGLIIISAPEHMHQQIRELLDQLNMMHQASKDEPH